MNLGVHTAVLRRYPVALIVVAGTLRFDTAPHIRAVALKVLVDNPTALVLDLTAVEIAEPAAVTVLPVIEQHAAWGDVALLLAGPSAALRDELRRLGSTLPLFDSRSDALHAAAAAPVPSRARLAFGPEATSAASARRTTRRACERWGLAAPLQDRAVQVVNELVTNVVVHARTPGVLLLTRRPSYLHVAVRDGSRSSPVLRTGTSDDGFGLVLVAALSTAWGTRTTPDGKVLWATLRIWPTLLPGQHPATGVRPDAR